MLNVLLAAATFHDKSKAPFFIAAGVLVAWALLVSAFGIRSDRFPTSSMQGRAVMGISAVLVVVTAAMGILTAKTPPPAHPYDTSAVTNGVAPTITPIVTGSSGATGATTPPTSSSGGALALAANPSGQLAYDTKTLAASSGNVTIDFTNKSPLPHNVTIANASGKVLGATPTFTGGEKTLKLNLPPGTYTFYCSVPGHEQAGMKGTLTVRAGGPSTGATGTTGTTELGAWWGARARREPVRPARLRHEDPDRVLGQGHDRLHKQVAAPSQRDDRQRQREGAGRDADLQRRGEDAQAQPAARHLHVLLLGARPRAGRHEGHTHRSLSGSKPAHSSTGSRG